MGKSSDEQMKIDHLFHLMLLIIAFGAIFDIAQASYVNAVCMSAIKRDKDKPSYGAQRCFSSIGFVIAGLIGGGLADIYKVPGKSNYVFLAKIEINYCGIQIRYGKFHIYNHTKIKNDNITKPR